METYRLYLLQKNRELHLFNVFRDQVSMFEFNIMPDGSTVYHNDLTLFDEGLPESRNFWRELVDDGFERVDRKEESFRAMKLVREHNLIVEEDK